MNQFVFWGHVTTKFFWFHHVQNKSSRHYGARIHKGIMRLICMKKQGKFGYTSVRQQSRPRFCNFEPQLDSKLTLMIQCNFVECSSRRSSTLKFVYKIFSKLFQTYGVSQWVAYHIKLDMSNKKRHDILEIAAKKFNQVYSLRMTPKKMNLKHFCKMFTVKTRQQK